MLTRKKLLRVLLILIVFGLLNPQGVKVSAADSEVNIYFFYGEGCPHCAKAHVFLQEVADTITGAYLYEFEVYYVLENQDYFWAFTGKHNIEPQGVPTIFIGDRYWVGYSDTIKAEIQDTVNACLVDACPDYGREILPLETFPTEELTPEATVTPTAAPTQANTNTGTVTPPGGETVTQTPESGDPGNLITLPLIGTVDLSNQSLFLSTLIISFVDGFNPCSIWVLTMLLAITLNAGSRKKVFIIGFVFILVTGFIYALFIGGLFTVFKIINFIGWVQVIVAIVALIFGLVNIKDYFWYKEGISFTISDEKKPGIYKRIRRLMNPNESVWGLIVGTVVLAAGVSLVEFSCTAGFPMLWSNLMVSSEVSGLAFVGYLLVYMLIYQIDEMGIFLVSVFTLRKSKLEEKHGRILKLLGGILMLTLAGVMMINPSLMNNIVSSLVVFGFAFVVTVLILVIHRLILPKLGIRLGTEKRS